MASPIHKSQKQSIKKRNSKNQILLKYYNIINGSFFTRKVFS